LLARIQRLGNLFANGTISDPRAEVLDDGEVNVGLEKRETNLSQSVIDIGFGKLPLALEFSKDRLKPLLHRDRSQQR
jgi:hypothetical protein